MRIAAAVLLALALTMGQARAGGFEGPGVVPAVTSAAAALEAQDDAPCVLEGHILEKLPSRKDRYLFADQTGKVVVEIEREVFGHLTVRPRDRVRLVGEVDWDSKRPNEVEVDALTLLE
ncbi:MAG: NirD/YgiW/YdeI family stress tolerance protein [Desulfovibrio sp.]|nr:NirD/YgiW/YdeI family stress tolerance protein [Desulfovibrio sp.]